MMLIQLQLVQVEGGGVLSLSFILPFSVTTNGDEAVDTGLEDDKFDKYRLCNF